MVSTRPFESITTPVPSRWLPSVVALRASRTALAFTLTTDRASTVTSSCAADAGKQKTRHAASAAAPNDLRDTLELIWISSAYATTNPVVSARRPRYNHRPRKHSSRSFHGPRTQRQDRRRHRRQRRHRQGDGYHARAGR